MSRLFLAFLCFFRILFVIEGVITLCALFAYLRLTPQDGAHVSGHRSPVSVE